MVCDGIVIRAHSASLILSSHSNVINTAIKSVCNITRTFERVKATYLHPLQYRLHAVG